MKPTFFETPLDFRAWFRKHHRTADELVVGLHKRGTGTPSITWPESGWWARRSRAAAVVDRMPDVPIGVLMQITIKYCVR
jgi:hypothetical protein